MIDEEHWALWARWRVEGDPRMGFGSRNVLYTPPPKLPDDGITRPMLEMPTDEDYRLVALIDQAIEALAKTRPREAGYLEHYYGAYPGAPLRRSDRIQRMGLNPRAARHVIRRLEQWIDGWVDGHERQIVGDDDDDR